MTNMNQGYGQDDMPTAPQNVAQAGSVGSGGSGSGGSGSRGGGSRGGGRRRWAAVLAITAVVVGGGAFAAAEAATGAPAAPAALAAAGSPAVTTAKADAATKGTSTKDTPTKAAAKDHLRVHGRMGRLRRLGGMYGEYTYETKTGAGTLAFERGTIESVSGDDVVVRAHNGMTEAWTLTSKSIVREDGKRATDSALAPGELVFTGGPVSAGAHDIHLIVIRKAASSGSA
jgi:hypothetical protein